MKANPILSPCSSYAHKTVLSLNLCITRLSSYFLANVSANFVECGSHGVWADENICPFQWMSCSWNLHLGFANTRNFYFQCEWSPRPCFAKLQCLMVTVHAHPTIWYGVQIGGVFPGEAHLVSQQQRRSTCLLSPSVKCTTEESLTSTSYILLWLILTLITGPSLTYPHDTIVV